MKVNISLLNLRKSESVREYHITFFYSESQYFCSISTFYLQHKAPQDVSDSFGKVCASLVCVCVIFFQIVAVAASVNRDVTHNSSLWVTQVNESCSNAKIYSIAAWTAQALSGDILLDYLL